MTIEKAVQLAFDFDALADAPQPTIATNEPVRCYFCGETEPNDYMLSINHGGGRYGMCLKAWMLLNHCRAIVKSFDGGKQLRYRNCYANSCEIHSWGEWSRKPIPDCARLEYEEERAWLIRAGVPEAIIPELGEMT